VLCGSKASGLKFSNRYWTPETSHVSRSTELLPHLGVTKITIMFSAILFAPFYCVYREESYLVAFTSFARSKTSPPPAISLLLLAFMVSP